MRPTWQFETLEQLTPGFLEQHGIHGIIWDVDGTLTAYHDSLIAPTIAPRLRALLAVPTLRHVVVSNSPEERFRALGAMVPSIPALRVYALGGALHARCLHHGHDSMSPQTLDALLQAGAYALRKPNASLTREALKVLGCTSAAALMIGDQYLTDIAGAGMADVRSVKLATIARSSFPLSVRGAQVIENALFILRHRGRPSQVHHLSGEHCV